MVGTRRSAHAGQCRWRPRGPRTRRRAERQAHVVVLQQAATAAAPGLVDGLLQREREVGVDAGLVVAQDDRAELPFQLGRRLDVDAECRGHVVAHRPRRRRASRRGRANATTPGGSSGCRSAPTPIGTSAPSSSRSSARPEANSWRRAGDGPSRSPRAQPGGGPSRRRPRPRGTPCARRAGPRSAQRGRHRRHHVGDRHVGRRRQEMPSDWSNVTSPHFLAAVSRPSIVQRPSVDTVSTIVHGWNRRTSLAHTKNTLPAIGQSAVDR